MSVCGLYEGRLASYVAMSASFRRVMEMSSSPFSSRQREFSSS